MMTSWSTAGGLRPMRHQAKNRRHGLFIVPGVVGFALGNLDDACATHQKSDCLWQDPDPETPSPALEQVLRSHLAAQLIANQQQAALPTRQQVIPLKSVQRQKRLLTHKGNVVLYIAFFFALLQLPNIALRAGANALVTNFYR
jgi:hypothetical protein